MGHSLVQFIMQNIKCKTNAIIVAIWCFTALFCLVVFVDNSTSSTEKPVVVSSKTPDKTQTGLRVYKSDIAYNGYTLFVHLDLELPGTTSVAPVYLIDMGGNIVYQWMSPYRSRHARLKHNGNILLNVGFNAEEVYTTGEFYFPQNHDGVHELDPWGTRIWHYPYFAGHDFQILDNGEVLLEREEPIYEPQMQILSGRKKGSRVSPRFERVSREKKILWSWRSEEHIEELEKAIGKRIDLIGDWAHSNTGTVINDNISGKKDQRFRKGNVIFSFSEIDTIGVIDQESGKIVWAWGPGNIEGQHSPEMLASGNILIFDNGYGRGWSRVIEVNPITEKIVWEYHSTPKKDFYSEEVSNVQRLPNGNTLICEGWANRIFEITQQGEIVWDFISTFNTTAGGEGILRAYRYSSEHVSLLFQRIKDKSIK